MVIFITVGSCSLYLFSSCFGVCFGHCVWKSICWNNLRLRMIFSSSKEGYRQPRVFSGSLTAWDFMGYWYFKKKWVYRLHKVELFLFYYYSQGVALWGPQFPVLGEPWTLTFPLSSKRLSKHISATSFRSASDHRANLFPSVGFLSCNSLLSWYIFDAFKKILK